MWLSDRIVAFKTPGSVLTTLGQGGGHENAIMIPIILYVNLKIILGLKRWFNC